MPTAMHPQAKFDPIPPDLDLHELVDRTDNFEWVTRISLSQMRRLGPAGFEKLVQLHVVEGGRPLVLEGWDKLLPSNLFNVQWLESTYDKKQENVRDINAQSDIPMTTGHYLRAMKKLTNQWTPNNFRDERRQRLYLKDIDCPLEWYDQLKKIIPPNVFYMNENVSDIPSANQHADNDIFGAPAKTVAVAGDLMSSLPEEMRAQNLMCYIGHEGTYTPAHREMCASLGQNIMVEASSDQDGEKPGSSIWFMTETKDRDVVREFFLSMLGHDIEIEKHFAQINAWKKANFPVQVVEQKPGDFILVPPLAPHQVWNRGTRTMKVAWNRTTVDTLGMAMQEALPKARLVCRDEQYKNKSIIYFTLEKYYKDLQSFQDSAENDWLGLGQELMQNNARSKKMLNDFKQLFSLFTNVLVSEMFGTQQKDVEFIPFDSNITCSYCRSNIFNRFLTCKCCVRPLINGDEDTYDICMECYAMGRSCVCISGLQFCEQWTWSQLVDKHELWRAMIIQQDGFVDIERSPPPLEIAKRLTGKKTVAQICQEQLKKRPWNDISQPPEQQAPESEPEPEVDEEGRVKKKKPKRKPKKGDVYKCHTCLHKDNVWKLQFCTTCPEAYCYGVLWRAFDIMPQEAMEQEHWQCPKCLGYCNCGSCRRTGHTTPYIPKNTLLGHDTRPIADDRSVEAVVDFRLHNLNWLKNTGEENRGKNTKRMQKLKEKAEYEKTKDYLQLKPGSQAISTQAADTNGHDDSQQHSEHPEYPDQDDMQNGRPCPLAHDGNDPGGSMVSTADMSYSWVAQPQADADADAEVSSYPDPSMMANGPMLGMGFYEQDDSEDRILFDNFDAAKAALAGHDDAQVADYVKKTMQHAKRKARLEKDDDPDFRAPKKHYNKRKIEAGNINQLANLDPALADVFGGNGTAISTPPNGEVFFQTSPQADHQQMQHLQHLQQEADVPERATPLQNDQPPSKQPLPIDPLRPTLRHAKPRISYVAPEEPPEDPNDVVPNRQHNTFGRRPKPAPADLPPDAIDQAADAIMGFAPPPTVPDSVEQAEGDREPEPEVLGRTRQQHDEASALTTTPVLSRPSPESRKRMRLERINALDEDASMHDAGDISDAEAEWDAATRAGNRDEDGSDPDFRQPKTHAPPSGKKRGRPPKNKAPPPPPRNEPSDDEDLHVVTPPPAKRRGRPPRKSAPVAPVAQVVPSSVQANDVQFLSMAERMALKGKKFKIRGRKSTPASTESPNTAIVTPQIDASKGLHVNSPRAKPSGPTGIGNPKPAYQPEFSDDDANSSSSASSIAAEPSPRRKGPTVVRLDKSSGSDDDSDISSGKPTYVATRGRGRPRGRPRGSGRARGTGRGRGRPRAV